MYGSWTQRTAFVKQRYHGLKPRGPSISVAGTLQGQMHDENTCADDQALPSSGASNL
jgi:hypothetical protein